MSATFTVAEALQSLRAAVPNTAPVQRGALIQLGKDCAAVCRARKIAPEQREVFGKDWRFEKAYPVDVLEEVFSRNPATREAFARMLELREPRDA